MRRWLLLILPILLAGCSVAGQVEGQAFAVALGIDRGPDGGIMLSARYPSYGANGKDEKSDYLLTAAAGPDFADALFALNAAVPRALNLTQVKSLIISEEIAASEDFYDLLLDLKLSRLDGEACLMVCRGEARALMEAQRPLIGLRLSDTMVTEIERYRRLGTIPESTLRQVFYDAASVYSDPVAICAAVTPEDRPLDGASTRRAGAGELIYEGENRDQYFGAALFRGGSMVSALGGGETQLLQLVRGGAAQMPMTMGGKWLTAGRRGAARVRIDLDAGRVDVSLTVGVEDLYGEADEEEIAREVSERLDELTRACQALAVEPFGYARAAAAQFPTLQEWTAFDWRTWFSGAEVVYHIRVETINR